MRRFSSPLPSAHCITVRFFRTTPCRHAGASEAYGDSAKAAMSGVVAPGAMSAEARESAAIPLPGKATAAGTAFTCQRSTVFDQWHYKCPDEVGWTLSKLGCTTCKMPKDIEEATDSMQLQVIKGLNIFEIDPQATDIHQKLSRALTEAIQAFELEREGFVVTSRGGIIKEQLFQAESAETAYSNTSAVVSKWAPIVNRFKSSSLPQMSLKTGFKISEMNDDQLKQLHMRRIDERTAACLTPEWLEASLTNIHHNTKIETIDVFFVEGLHTLFDERTDAEIDEHILGLFKFLEIQAEKGAIQYYGISSEHLAPPLIRKPLEIPKDANMPKKYLNPKPTPKTIDLYRLMRIAEEAGGKNHKLRFIQYPFNMTQHQAHSTPLPYDSNHTLVSLAKRLGLTTIGMTPVEAPDQQGLPQRYHKFPMDANLKNLRQSYLSVVERCLLKEMEMAPNIEKAPHSMPKMTDVFIGSLLLAVQRQTDNLFFYNDWIHHKVVPNFRRGLVKLREGSPGDVKEWAHNYQQLVEDLVQLRRRQFEYDHGRRAMTIDTHINALSPTLSKCPIMAQKAINFATQGADVTVCGFHRSRYFMEATDMNPRCLGDIVDVPEEEMAALCSSPDVTYADANPPDPYMYDVLLTPKISGQKPRMPDEYVMIDPQNPKYPDCPEEVLGTGDEDEDAALGIGLNKDDE